MAWKPVQGSPGQAWECSSSEMSQRGVAERPDAEEV